MIIHDENTKEITTAKEVWITVLICIDFAILLFVFSAFNDQFQKLYQTLEQLFYQIYLNTLKWVKKIRLRLVFLPTFQSLNILIKNSFLCLIYYISNAIDHGGTSIMIVQSIGIPGYHSNGTIGCQSHHY